MGEHFLLYGVGYWAYATLELVNMSCSMVLDIGHIFLDLGYKTVNLHVSYIALTMKFPTFRAHSPSYLQRKLQQGITFFLSYLNVPICNNDEFYHLREVKTSLFRKKLQRVCRENYNTVSHFSQRDLEAAIELVNMSCSMVLDIGHNFLDLVYKTVNFHVTYTTLTMKLSTFRAHLPSHLQRKLQQSITFFLSCLNVSICNNYLVPHSLNLCKEEERQIVKVQARIRRERKILSGT